ncbi:MAG: glycosyltransferase [Calditrichia bacterium]
MNILQIVNVRWWNASAYYAVLQGLGLKQLGHKVYIAGKKDSLPLKKAQEWGLEIVDDINLESTKPTIAAKILVKYPSLLRELSIDVVNPHRGENYPLIAYSARKLGLPVVRTRGDARPPRHNLFSKWQNNKLTDFHILSLKKMIPYYQAIDVPVEKMKVLYGAVHPDFNTIQRSRKLNQKYITFGILARLAPIKGHELIFKAMHMLKKDYPEIQLLIGGKEERLLYDDIRKLIKQYGLEKQVTCLGFVENVMDFFNRIDVGISASYDSEVICRICFEMMSQKIPMIVSRWNVLEEIIQDGTNGLIFDRMDHIDLAEKMRYLIEHPEMILTLGNNARKAIEENYTLSIFSRQVEQIFENLVHGKN